MDEHHSRDIASSDLLDASGHELESISFAEALALLVIILQLQAHLRVRIRDLELRDKSLFQALIRTAGRRAAQAPLKFGEDEFHRDGIDGAFGIGPIELIDLVLGDSLDKVIADAAPDNAGHFALEILLHRTVLAREAAAVEGMEHALPVARSHLPVGTEGGHAALQQAL